MNAASYRLNRKESPIELTLKWVLTALLVLMISLGLASQYQSISTVTIDKLFTSDGAAKDF